MMSNKLLFSITIGLLVWSLSVSGQSIVVKKPMKSGTGHFEADIVKGRSFGTKINVGKKEIKLTGLKMNLTKDYTDSLTFSIKIYPIHNRQIGEAELMTTQRFTVKPNNKEVNVDLSGEDLILKGNVLLSVEWLETARIDKQLIIGSGFAKSGIYSKENPEAEWKKVPLFGLNIEVLGEREGK